jgi:hypothetical protein
LSLKASDALTGCLQEFFECEHILRSPFLMLLVVPDYSYPLESLTFGLSPASCLQTILLCSWPHPMRAPTMRSVFSALMAYVLSRFRSHQSLRLENMALRHQLAVYQQTVKRPKLCSSDRLFWVWLSHLWPDWQQALEFVQPRTVIAWQKHRCRDYWRRRSQSGKPGRPAIAQEVCDLIQDMWRSNPLWGSPRIVGELRKLGITVAKSTVEKYRPRVRKPPSPTWKAFLHNHVKDLVACDVFTVPTASFKILFVFIMLAHERRRLLHFNITAHPTAQWTAQQIVEAFPWEIGTRSTVGRSNTASRTWASKKSKLPRAVPGRIPTASGSSAAFGATCSSRSSSSTPGISSDYSRPISPTITAFAPIFPWPWIAPTPARSSPRQPAG